MLKYAPIIAISMGLAACAARREVVVVEKPVPRHDVAYVERTGWVMLGERTVEGNYDHDAIQVGEREGRFNRMAFRVENHSIEIFDIKVTFGDGSTFDVPSR